MWLSLEEQFENWWNKTYPGSVDGKSAAFAAWKKAYDVGYRDRCYEEKCAM